MFVDALIFTASFVVFVLSAAGLVAWWFITESYGQHAGAGEGAMSVEFFKKKIDAEVRALVETTRPLSPEKRMPIHRQQAVAPVWTLPELVAA